MYFHSSLNRSNRETDEYLGHQLSQDAIQYQQMSNAGFCSITDYTPHGRPGSPPTAYAGYTEFDRSFSYEPVPFSYISKSRPTSPFYGQAGAMTQFGNHSALPHQYSDECFPEISPSLTPPLPNATEIVTPPLSPELEYTHFVKGWDIAEQYFHVGDVELSTSSLSDLSVELTLVDTSGGSLGRPLAGVDAILDQMTSNANTSMTSSYQQPQQQPSSFVLKRERNDHRRSSSTSKKHKKSSQTFMDIITAKQISAHARQEQNSRALQQHLRSASRFERQLALDQVTKELGSLSCHVFGNYVIQKFLEYGSVEQRTQITTSLEDAAAMAQHQYGCRVIQKAIEVAEMSAKLVMFKRLEPHFKTLIQCEHGNHVVQKCVVAIPSEQLTSVFQLFEGKTVDYCVKMYECRVVQRLLAKASPRFKSRMIRDILDNGLYLAKDTWGNYVVQYIIENGEKDVSERVVDMIVEHFQTLSFHKLASNVVEKCLEFATPSAIDLVTKVFLDRSNDDLVDFITHDFGNYVIQTLIDRASYRQGAYKIHKRLKKFGLMQRIKAVTAGRRVAAKLDDKASQYQMHRHHGSDRLNSSYSSSTRERY